MRKVILFAAALAALAACGTSETKDNDPWAKIEIEPEEPATVPSKVEECSMYSSSLKQSVPYSVWLPRDYDPGKAYPFLYLLHGYEYEDPARLDLMWLKKGNAAQIAAEYQKNDGVPMVIVMPNGYSSFYVGEYESFLEEELIAHVEEQFHGNGKRAIAGLSMGGFGTLYHSLKYPAKFTYAYAMSPAAKMYGIDPGSYIPAQKDKSVFPALTIEVGTEDTIVNNEDARALYERMTANGIACEWIERSGKHDWVFWKVCLPKALRAAGESFK